MTHQVAFSVFKEYALQQSQVLLSMGYSLKHSIEREMIVKYEKFITDSCYARIYFQYNWNYLPPEQTFIISLRRSSYKGKKDNMPCSVLNVPLFKLLILKSLVPPDELKTNFKGWVYTNELELKSQLETAMKYLLSYGIPWLEDPSTTMK